jgi:hypothetical protein
MKVVIFNTTTEMQAYLTTNAVTKTMVSAIYFDAASGKHILVYTP